MYKGFGDDERFASGLEARYIVEQATGTDASRLALVNERRAANGQGVFAGTGDALLEELLRSSHVGSTT